MARLAGDTEIKIGEIITRVIAEKKISKAELGRMLGIAAPAVTYLTTRDSIDVNTLHKVGLALKYNFFKHYVVDEGQGTGDKGQGEKIKDEKDKVIEELKGKIAELENALQKQENSFLREINELLKKK